MERLHYSKLIKSFVIKLYIGETTEKEGGKSLKKSRTLYSDCFSNTFQFLIHVKEIKTENGSQGILGVARARKMMQCQPAHPCTDKGHRPTSENWGVISLLFV